jgi:hypothetical protein
MNGLCKPACIACNVAEGTGATGTQVALLADQMSGGQARLALTREPFDNPQNIDHIPPPWLLARNLRRFSMTEESQYREAR